VGIACVPTPVDDCFPSARVHFVVLALQLHLRVFPAGDVVQVTSQSPGHWPLWGRRGNAQIGERNTDRDHF